MFAGRRDAVEGALLGSLIEKARRGLVAGGEARLNGDLEIGQALEPRREEVDRRRLRREAGRRMRRGARLMIDVVVGEQGREGVQIMGGQGLGETLDDRGARRRRPPEQRRRPKGRRAQDQSSASQ